MYVILADETGPATFFCDAVLRSLDLVLPYPDNEFGQWIEISPAIKHVSYVWVDAWIHQGLFQFMASYTAMLPST